MIEDNYLKIRDEISGDVAVVLVVKGRGVVEVERVVDVGARELGGNYVQETERMINALGERAGLIKWHMIGKLQKNKVNRALKIFDVIQTVDSFDLACAIDKRAREMERIVEVYLQVNIGREDGKSGVEPDIELILNLVGRIFGECGNLKLRGLMCIEPSDEGRVYFRKMRGIFDRVKSRYSGIEVLSMGMSGSYGVAIEEGGNMIRIGNGVFGER